MERDDRGNLFVLEATMISLILLGAAYAVQGLQDSSVVEVRPRAELSRLVDDALSVLSGLDVGNGTLLDIYLAEAIHCATDPVPSPDDCDDHRSENLSIKLESYLPLGAGYAIGIGNGAAVREIYRSPMPQGEAVSSSQTYALNWSFAFLYTELSCYEPGTSINATLLPISRAYEAYVAKANVSLGGVETVATRAYDAHAWNVTIAGATRPATGTISANVTDNASTRFPGSTSYASCAHGGATGALRNAQSAIQLRPGASAVPLTSALVFEADLGAIATLLPAASIVDANVTVYEPIPPRASGADSWVAAALLPLEGAGGTRTATWTPPETSLYGAHPALLRVGLDVGGVDIELRKAIVVDVALAPDATAGGGQPIVPLDPPYRITLQAWMADWG